MECSRFLSKLKLATTACFLFSSLSLADDLVVTGLVQPVWEATLAPTVLGRVESILVKEGDQVNAGDALLYLERRFEELDADRRRIVSESAVELELASAKLEVLRSEFESTKKLFESSGSISKEEFERSRLDFQLAEAEISQLEEREKVEALELELALEQVSRREIRTPQDGTVVEIFPKTGEVCEPRQPLLRIVDTSTVRITLDVDAMRTGGMKMGALVSVTVEAPGGDVEVEGEIDFVSPVVDGASGLRRIQISIENAEGSILPGLPARVTFSNGD